MTTITQPDTFATGAPPLQSISPQPIGVRTPINVPNGMSEFARNNLQSTQANGTFQSLRPPEVIQRLTFSSETIKRLTTDDFDIGAKELVAIKYDDCILVLFHIENTESYQLADIWAIVAQQVAGPVFGAINMLNERKVAEAFTRLKSDGSHPLHWASLRQYPFIMVYRKRWPVAIYNGPREVQALIDYALTLACEAGYYEPLQTGGSMQAEGRIEMGPYGVYTNIPGNPPRVRRDSLEYTASEPIRGFNPNIPVVVTGSINARQETNTIRSEELQQQQGASQDITTSLTENDEQAPTRTSGLIGEQPPTGPPAPQQTPIILPAEQPTTASTLSGLPPPTIVTSAPPTIVLPATR